MNRVLDLAQPAELGNPHRLARWGWDSKIDDNTVAAPCKKLHHLIHQSERVDRGVDAALAAGPMVTTRGQADGSWHNRIGLTVREGTKVRVVARIAGKVQRLVPEVLDQYKEFQSLSFPMEVPVEAKGRWVQYKVTYRDSQGNKVRERYPVWHAGSEERNRVSSNSCNGVMNQADLPKDGAPQNWYRFVNDHLGRKPVAVSNNGGDNAYADGVSGVPGQGGEDIMLGKDGVFNLPSVKKWFAAVQERVDRLGFCPSPEELEGAWNLEITSEMKEEVEYFYFCQYIKHYNTPMYNIALATTLQENAPDDHDSYDGRGSRPSWVEGSPGVTLIRTAADRNFYTFQKQLGEKSDFVKEGFFGREPRHAIRLIQGGKTAMVSLDCRAERTPTQVFSEETRSELYQRLRQLEGCKRVLVTLSCPVTLPEIPVLDKILARIPVKDIYGDPGLKDDAVDAWHHHKVERDELLRTFGDIAQERGFVVTVISGDIHFGYQANVTPTKKADVVEGKDLRVIQEFVSSGMIQVPLPTPLPQITAGVGAWGHKTEDGTLKMMFKDLVKQHKPSSKKAVITRRHYLNLDLRTDGTGTAQYVVEPKEDATNRNNFTSLVAKLYDANSGQTSYTAPKERHWYNLFGIA